MTPTSAVDWAICIPSALTFAASMIALNAAMGLYRPVYQRSHRQTFARVALSLTVSVPVAYLVFGLLPWSEIAPALPAAQRIAVALFAVAGPRAGQSAPGLCPAPRAARADR